MKCFFDKNYKRKLALFANVGHIDPHMQGDLNGCLNALVTSEIDLVAVHRGDRPLYIG